MTKEKRIIVALLFGLFFLPAGATLVHFKIHPDIAWLPYLTIIDAVVVTLLFCFRRTAVYALFLNTIFFIVGIGYHLRLSAWSDVLMSIPDFLMGYAVYLLVMQAKDQIKNKTQ